MITLALVVSVLFILFLIFVAAPVFTFICVRDTCRIAKDHVRKRKDENKEAGEAHLP